MTNAEQIVTAWAVIGILWVVMGTAGLDLSPQVEAIRQRQLEFDANNYTSVLDRRLWQRWIGLALIVAGTGVAVQALVRLFLIMRF